MSEKKIFLLDAMALIYRAYFALNRNPRINSKGQNTSAPLGFTNTLWDVISNEKPTHLGIAFDSFAPTLRHEDFAEYKATRERMPEDIASSLPYIRAIIEAFNIPIIEKEGYEADDIIGTLAKKAESEGYKVYMMTPDKDFGQLVSDNIFMYKPARMGNSAEILGPEEVCAKYNIERPEQLIDILGLWGDASDNIPGIPGIGEKTASKLIAEYGSMENLIANADKLKGKQKENVENFAEQGLMSKQLATIILDAPVEWNDEKLKLVDPDIEKLNEIFIDLEFRTLGKRIFSSFKKEETESAPIEGLQGSLFGGDLQPEANGMETLESSDVEYHLVDSKEGRSELINKLKSSKEFCFDTETTGLDALTAELVGMSFAIKEKESWYVTIPENREEAQQICDEFKEVFESDSIGKIAQNIKYDLEVLGNYNIQIKGEIFDTMIAHYLLQPDMRHNMDVLAETYLDYRPVSIETLIGKKGKNQRSIRTVELNKLKDYACEDADITLRLYIIFKKELEANEMFGLFRDIEMPLIHVLASMEREGVSLDTEALKEYSALLASELIEIESRIYSHAGTEFNISSPKQLGEILFGRMKITEKAKKTKTGQYSTSEDVLQKLINKHDIVKDILEYRSLSKLKSTYVDALPDLISHNTGKIHTSYNQAVAATGRLSSNNPNLQNIPIRTERGREIRKAFISDSDDKVLLAADYSQVELRIIAHLSKDEGMMQAFNENMDIHTATASRVYGVDPEEVDKEMRRKAKMVNFGLIYGISAFGLSERLNISRGEASEIISEYFRQYPGIRKYMDESIASARELGYVKTIMGRRRYLRDIDSRNATVRQFAERNAINAPIQGSSADMIKIAMIDIHKEMQERGLKSKMILQVHDELVFDAWKDELDELQSIIKDKMMAAIKLDVPLEIDMNTGTNWLEAH